MITKTLQEALHAKDKPGTWMYILRDAEANPLYIGVSEKPYQTLRDNYHSRWGTFSQAFLEAVETTDKWTFSVCTDRQVKASARKLREQLKPRYNQDVDRRYVSTSMF